MAGAWERVDASTADNGREPMADPAQIRRSVTTTRIVAVRDGARLERPDKLAGEEPMEIRAGGPGQEPSAVAVTMRTPGGDFELAAGFLFTEGLIRGPEDLERVAYCDLPRSEQHYNVVTVTLTRPWDAESLRRNFYATSSCGICGKAALEDVEVRCAAVAPGPVVDGATIASLPDRLRGAQRVFERTGGLHAAGLFDPSGELIALREDVGRHNAVDKVIGEQLLAGRLPLADRILQVSGRVSFEIVQKAAVAGVPIVSAVSAPSSLAVDAGDRLGMTIVGFVRGGRFNVYAHPERVA
jgi:FdhD protein